MPKAKKQSIEAVMDRVIVEVEELADQSAGGIFIPETAQRRDMIGTIRSIGPETPMCKLESLKTGDRVLYNEFSQIIKIMGVDYRVVKEKNILVKLPKGDAHTGKRSLPSQTSKDWVNLD